MPPRKSNASVASAPGATPVPGDTSFDSNATIPIAAESTPSEKKPAQKEGLGVEDLGLPRTMVQRLAKGVLPANTQIQKDAQLAMWKSATVFVNYLASHANDNAIRSSKKTIQPKDVLDAIHDLEFDLFLPRLEAELAKYHDNQCTKRNTYRKKVRDEAKDAQKPVDANGNAEEIIDPLNSSSTQPGASAASPAHNDVVMSANDASVGRDNVTEPASKKARRSDGGAAAVNSGDEDEGADDEEEDHQEEDVVDEEDEEEVEEEDEEMDGEPETLVEDHDGLEDEESLRRKGLLMRDDVEESDEDSD